MTHPRIQKLVERLDAQAPELLTFQASVARLWRLEHALRNGHSNYQAATVVARQRVAEFVANDPGAHRLAQDLLTVLERTVRTSCAAETINSVLRQSL